MHHLIAGAMMVNVTDAVEDRIAQVDVGRSHVDLRAEDVLAIGKFSGFHSAEQVEIFLDRALAVWAVLAGLGQRAAERAHFLGGETVHIRFALLDKIFGALIKFIEIIGRVVEVRAPVEPEPPDGIHVLNRHIPALPFQDWYRRSAGGICRYIPGPGRN